MSIRTQVETVTPKKAEQWLRKNASNRRLSDITVNAMVRDIQSGHWQLTPEAITFNVRGDLLNGQHRLTAVIKSGCSVKMTISRGWSHSVRGVLDRTRRRTITDRMKMDGIKGRLGLKSACSSLLVKLDRGTTRETVTGDEAMEALVVYSGEFSWLDTATLSAGYRVASYVGPVMWAMRLGDRVIGFHEGVQSGAGLVARSPELAMRTALARTGNGYTKQLDIVLKTCNAIEAAMSGRRVSVLRATNAGYLALAKRMSTQLPDIGTLVTASEG